MVNLGGKGFPKGLLVITPYLTDLYVKLPGNPGLKSLNSRANIVLTLGWNSLYKGR